MSLIEVVEVGPRDGLQNESRTLSQSARFAFVQHLAKSGLKRIEVGAFVSPQWVPQMVEKFVRGDVDAFLASQGLDRKRIAHWVCHSGGPKVLEAFETALEQPRAAFQRTWDSLDQVGNLSSASVLFVLADTLAEVQAKPGDYGLMLAMGPGFCSELVLLRW